MISDVAQESAKIGLELHPDKTKTLHNGIGYGSRVTKADCNGMKIEVLSPGSHTMYLGIALRMGDKRGEEVRNRTTKAWAKSSIYREQLVDREIPIKHWIQLFDAIVTPTVLCGSRCWVMTADRQHKLRTVQRRMLRMILGTKRKYSDSQATAESYVE